MVTHKGFIHRLKRYKITQGLTLGVKGLKHIARSTDVFKSYTIVNYLVGPVFYQDVFMSSRLLIYVVVFVNITGF